MIIVSTICAIEMVVCKSHSEVVCILLQMKIHFTMYY